MSIVVCLPGGDADGRLQQAGVAQARALEQPLVLLRHVKVHTAGTVADAGAEVAAAHGVRAELEAVAEGITTSGVDCRAEVLTSASDQPSDDLLEAIAAKDPALLVIGKRSRSRVGKFLMGSTTQDLLMGTRVAVLCVPVEPDQG